MTPSQMRAEAARLAELRAAPYPVLGPAAPDAYALAAQVPALLDENEALRAELETERMRLAACGVVAMSDTPESAERNRQMRPEYWSASCGDVARRVDECMALRQRIAELERDAGRYRWLRHGDNDEPVLRYEPSNGDRDAFYWLLRSEELDAAIDAAMQAQTKEGGN